MGIRSKKGFNIPKRIIFIDNIWRIPNSILISGKNIEVIKVIKLATKKRISPRFKFECDNCDDIPDISINIPAKYGSRGIKKLRSFNPELEENKNAILKNAW